MEATAESHDEPATATRAWTGWLLGALGLAGVSWWIWAWSKVQTLINDHVSEWGPLPTSPMERAMLYANGTPAEQQLSSDLEGIAGLYPWGQMPLLLAGLAALFGFVLALEQNRFYAAIGICVTVLLALWSTHLWGSVNVALDILE